MVLLVISVAEFVRTCLRLDRAVYLLLINLLLTAGLTFGQRDPVDGSLPFSTHKSEEFYSVDPSSGNITVTIPVISKAGKIPFSLSLVGNFHAFVYNAGQFGGNVWVVPNSATTGGLRPAASGSLSSGLLYSTVTLETCNDGAGIQYEDSSFALTDATGVQHSFPLSTIYGNCYSASGSGSVPATDGSGYVLTATESQQNGVSNFTYAVRDRSGNTVPSIHLGSTQLGFQQGGQWSDPDGVTMSVTPQSVQNGTQYTYVDTLDTAGQNTLVATLSTNDTYVYKDVNGNNQTATVNYTKYTQRTNFQCSGIGDSNEGALYFPTSVVLADGEIFGLTYETTPGYTNDITGRLAKLTLPTGGYITFAYSEGINNTGIQCTTNPWGNMATLTVTANDGQGSSSQWTYTSSSTDSYGNFTTTETDPVGDTTTYHFAAYLLTEKVVTDVNLGVLSTEIRCYNGNNTSQSACITPELFPQPLGDLTPIVLYQTDVYTSLGTLSPALIETSYDYNSTTKQSFGNITAVKEWDFGATYPPSGSPISTTTTTYANIGGVTCGSIVATIYDHPCSITETNSSGGTMRQTLYTYSTTGHATNTSRWVSASQHLTTTATYNSNGTLASFTDVNSSTQSPATTYFYYNGTGGCNNMLLTSTTNPAGLTTSRTWNCVGGVLTSFTDANNQLTTYGYVDQDSIADPLWRQLSVTDSLNNTTWTAYSPGGTVPMTVESSLTFNGGASTVDKLTTMDGLGRPYLSQVREQPAPYANFDTVVTTYDLLGRTSSVSMPCVSVASQPCSAPVATTTYDALNRWLKVAAADGGYQQFQHTKNDVLLTLGPAPAGENTKQRQLEYDGLGRLTSVCEITAGTTTWPGGNCAQKSAKTGYWTKMAYDSLNRLTSVSQNAQSSHPQGRSFFFDGLSRMTSEVNPETGTSIYTYDTDSTCGTYQGDLVKRSDAAANVTCIAYDAIHRAISKTYPSGPYVSVTPSKTFVYDSTTFSCTNQTGSFVKGRLAEAYTGPSTGKSTDIGYCYSQRGENTDVLESTPNSKGYYHVTAGYLANGALNTLSGVPGLSGWTFAPDPQGRPNSVSYGTSTNWVTSTTYYPSNNSIPPNDTVTFGNSATDVYTFDANTGRMAGFTFTVGASNKTFVGAPGWNSNGTLGTLGVTNNQNSVNTQNCSYVYDDLSRINSVNCVNGSTTKWSQTFAFDAFGNITKTGSGSFAASYLLSNGNTNNQEQSVASCIPTYDADGNMTKDCTFATPANYAWDADGNAISIAGQSVTYDALDRPVEFANGTGYTQHLYAPIGNIGLMNGQKAVTIRIPLPEGSTAELIGAQGGTTHILHSDWLGAGRLSTVYPGNAIAYTAAYAPYAESYDAAGSSSGDLDFTGQFQDTVAGLYDFQYREYDTAQGRWISPDPAGRQATDPSDPQTWNQYAHVRNSPLDHSDPLGLYAANPGCLGPTGFGSDCPGYTMDGPADSGAALAEFLMFDALPCSAVNCGLPNVSEQAPPAQQPPIDLMEEAQKEFDALWGASNGFSLGPTPGKMASYELHRDFGEHFWDLPHQGYQDEEGRGSSYMKLC